MLGVLDGLDLLLEWGALLTILGRLVLQVLAFELVLHLVCAHVRFWGGSSPVRCDDIPPLPFALELFGWENAKSLLSR